MADSIANKPDPAEVLASFDVEKWLTENKLQPLVAKFKEHDIDISEVLEMATNEADLR